MKSAFYILFLISFYIISIAQDCNITSKANDMLPDKLCAPVTVTWTVIYRGVNDAGTPVEIAFDWDDGNPMQIVTANNTNPVLKEWSVTIVHVYPQGGNRCNYRPAAYLRVNGILCTSSIQQQNVTVWDIDCYNGGQLQIIPQIYPICVGNEATVIFQDVSTWNCEPPVETDNPNDYKRWTQWIYGTNYTINGVLVNGNSYSYPYNGPIVTTTEPIYGPQPPNNTSLPVYVPNTAQVGQIFEVMLRNWNYCNPYDDPNIPGSPSDPINGDHPPIVTTAYIIIVPIPDATITPAGPFCSNAPSTTLQAATSGGIWSGNGITNATTGTFSPSAAGPGLHTITYTVTDANGCTNSDTIQIRVWARPTINILPGDNLTVCPGDTLYLNGNPTPGDGAIISHQWTGTGAVYLNSTNIQTPYFVCNTPGTYNLTYRVIDENGCSRQANMTIKVASISANILPNPAQGCSGSPIQLYGNPTGGTGNYVIHQWSGADTLLNNNNIINPIFLSNDTGLYQLLYYVQDNLGCSATASITIKIYQTPIANAGINDSICGLNYQLNAIPSIGNGIWSKISGPGNVFFSNLNDPQSNVMVTLNGYYVLQWQETFGPGCASKDCVVVNFIQIPSPYAGNDIEVCGLQYILSATPSIGYGTWSYISDTGNAEINFPYNPSTNVTVDNYSSYYFIWTENNNGCINSDTVKLTFYQIPQANAGIDTNVCGLTYDLNAIQSIGTGLWSKISGPGNAFFSDVNNPLSNIQVTQYGEYILQWQETYGPGCISKDSIKITFIQIPAANAGNDTSICGKQHILNAIPSVGIGQWQFLYGSGNCNIITPYSHITEVKVDTFGSYYFLWIENNNNCINYDTVRINFDVVPIASFTLSPNSGCTPLNVNLQNTSSYSVFSEWTFSDGYTSNQTNPSHTFINNTQNNYVYYVKLKVLSQFGCADSAFDTIIVNPKPISQFTHNAPPSCSPLTVNFTNTSMGATSYLWDFGDNQISNITNPYHTFLNDTGIILYYTIQLIATNNYNCSDTSIGYITVFPTPQHNIIVTPDSSCTPAYISFITEHLSQVYIWDFGDNSQQIGNNQIYHYYYNNTNVPITYNVTLYTSNSFGCKDTAYTNVTILPIPKSQFTYEPFNQCSPATVNFINLSENASFYEIRFGDNTTISGNFQNIEHTYINNTDSTITYIVKLIAYNEFMCADTFSLPVTVYPQVKANFSCNTEGCSPLNVSFINNTINGNHYLWDFGDGNTSTISNPQHTFYNNSDTIQNFTITLVSISENECIDTFIKTINVYPASVAQLLIPVNYGCSPLNVTIYNNSVNSNNTIIYFGDGSNETLATTITSHLYYNITTNLITYTISLTTTNEYNCKDSTSQYIMVYPEVKAAFNCDTAGCSPFLANFYNFSANATSYLWNFGDNNISNEINPVHTFINNTTETETLTVTLTAISQYQCMDTAIKQIKIYPVPNVNFIVDSTTLHYPNTTTHMLNITDGNWNYLWQFGDGSTSAENQPHSHTYNTWGTYNICLIAYSNYCSDTLCTIINIIPPVPIALYEPSEFYGCAPLTVALYNLSQYAESYLWQFGDGNISTQVNPVYTYSTPGVYNITLIATGPGGQSQYSAGIVNVYHTASAYFVVTPSVVYIPDQPITCINLSQNASSFLWYFGDGTTSTEFSPKHYYTVQGQYDITLIANNEHNCPDTFTITRAVTAEVTGEIIFPSAFTPNPDGPCGGKYNKNDLTNDVFHPIFIGVREYNLQIYTRWGELIFESNDINIGWDGYYKNKLCKQDVYIWKAKGKFLNGQSFDKAGTVTLIR